MFKKYCLTLEYQGHSSSWNIGLNGVIFLPSIAGGELFERIVDDNFEHTELTSARYMQQILEGMQYVHKQNIVHLDIKPENIVCVDTTGTRLKIIDFGLASELGEFAGFVDSMSCPNMVNIEAKFTEQKGPFWEGNSLECRKFSFKQSINHPVLQSKGQSMLCGE